MITFIAPLIFLTTNFAHANQTNVEKLKAIQFAKIDCQKTFPSYAVQPEGSKESIKGFIPEKDVLKAIQEMKSSKVIKEDYLDVIVNAANENPEGALAEVQRLSSVECPVDAYRTATALINTATTTGVSDSTKSQIRATLDSWIQHRTFPGAIRAGIELAVVKHGTDRGFWKATPERSEKIRSLQTRFEKLRTEINKPYEDKPLNYGKIRTAMIQEFTESSKILNELKVVARELKN